MKWLLTFAAVAALAAEQPKTIWSEREQPMYEQLRHLRDVPDAQRGDVTTKLAQQIRALPAVPNKLKLATGLAGLSTEGDFGQTTLQAVGETLAVSLSEQPALATDDVYAELAQLVRYERVQLSGSPRLTRAIDRLMEDDAARQQADFTLTDLSGKSWTLKQLSGKIVLVNFWATWCPPCRKEMPDLNALYARFKDQGLIVLAISDEDDSKVRPFVAERNVSYPVLLDPGRKVNELFRVQGIPKTFIYDREGHLAAQAIDMRTRAQFLKLLAQAGIQGVSN